MAQRVKLPALDVGLGHDPRVVGSSPSSCSPPTAWSLFGILSPFLSCSHAFSVSLSLSLEVNKLKKKEVYIELVLSLVSAILWGLGMYPLG